MATPMGAMRPNMAFNSLRLIARTSPGTLRRALSTLPMNNHIYVHEKADGGHKQYLYSYLQQTPPIPSLCIGSSPQNPPTPESLTENHDFMKILHWVVKDFAVKDPEVQAQAAAYASQAGAGLGSGGVFFQQSQRNRRDSRDRPRKQYGGGGGADGGGAGGASAQGGMGGAGRGGYIHVSDQRNPPDWGRVAYPEDILGSLEVDGEGKFVDGNGRYQESGTYRIMTNEGILGLSNYLREKVVERLHDLDAQARKNS